MALAAYLAILCFVPVSSDLSRDKIAKDCIYKDAGFSASNISTDDEGAVLNLANKDVFGWEQLLLPVPRILCLFGQLLLAANGADVKLAVGFNPKRLKMVDSLQGTLTQLVEEASNAFSVADLNMQTISTRMPDVIEGVNNMIDIVKTSEPENMIDDLQGDISALQDITDLCLQKVNGILVPFKEVQELIYEIIDIINYSVGKFETNKTLIENELNMTAQQKQQQEQRMKTYEQQLNESKARLKESDDAYNKAIDHLPTSWELFGQDIIKTVVKGAIDIGKSYLEMRTGAMYAEMIKDTMQGGGGGGNGSTDPSGQPLGQKKKLDNTATVAEKLTDCNTILQTEVDILPNKTTPEVGEGGEIPKIQNESAAIADSYKVCKNQMASIPTRNRDFMKKALDLADKGLNIFETVAKAGGKYLDIYLARSNLISLSNNIRTQSATIANDGDSEPDGGQNPAPQTTLTNEQLIVQLQHKRLEENAARFDQSQKQYNEANDKLYELVNKLATLNIDLRDLTHAIQVLRECIQYLTEIKIKWHTLVTFFSKLADSTNQLLGGGSPMTRLIKAMSGVVQNAKEKGKNVTDIVNHVMGQVDCLQIKLRQGVKYLGVTSKTYTEVSVKYIMPRALSLTYLVNVPDSSRKKKMFDLLQESNDSVIGMHEIIQKETLEYQKWVKKEQRALNKTLVRLQLL